MRAHPQRGEPDSGNRNATVQRLRRRPLGRNADGARGRVRERDRLGRLALVDRRSDGDALRLRERADLRVRREAEHRADEGVPRARLRRGHLRARVPDRRARREARPRSARSSVAATTPTTTRSTAVLLEEPARVLSPGAAPLGDRRDGPRPLEGRVEARRRDGQPDLVRRRRPAVLRVGADRRRRESGRDHRDAGHRHGHGNGDGADRGRGSGCHRPGRRLARRLGSRPTASISAGSSTVPSMGPAVRAAAADAAGAVEIAAQRYDHEQRTLAGRWNIVSADGGSWPLEEVTGLDDAQILGKGSRGPNPTGMQRRSPASRSRRWRWTSKPARSESNGSRRSTTSVGINPSSIEPGRGRDHPGPGHTLSEERLLDPRTGSVLTPTLDAYKLPTIADVPEIVPRPGRRPRPASDEPRIEGLRGRDRPDVGGDRERDSRRDRGRRPLLPITREEMLRALREGASAARSALELLRPDSVETATSALDNGAVAPRARTELVPLMREGSSRPTGSSRSRALCHAGSAKAGSAGGTTLGELEVDPQIPAALEASMLAASPQLRAMGTIAGNLLQATRCWYWRLQFPCRLHGGDRCFAREDSTASMRSRERLLRSASVGPAAALLALSTTVVTDRRRLPLADLYRVSQPGRPADDHAGGPS